MRILLLDISRGICVFAMILYHFYWDLAYFGFIDIRIVTQGLGLFIAQLIGASFITIAGISSKLLSLSNNFEAKFIKRTSKLIFISLAISIITFIIDKNSFIFFGILHFLSICSVVSLILIKLKTDYQLFLFFLIAGFISVSGMTFNMHSSLSWIGLSKEIPKTNDFYPIFPWITFYFLGFWAGGIMSRRLDETSVNFFVHSNRKNVVLKFFELTGRNSLPVYILHQPILFSLIFVFIQLTS